MGKPADALATSTDKTNGPGGNLNRSTPNPSAYEEERFDMEILKGSQGTVNPRTPSQVAHFYQNVNFENLASDPNNTLKAAFHKGSSEGTRAPLTAASHGEQSQLASSYLLGGTK